MTAYNHLEGSFNPMAATYAWLSTWYRKLMYLTNTFNPLLWSLRKVFTQLVEEGRGEEHNGIRI